MNIKYLTYIANRLDYVLSLVQYPATGERFSHLLNESNGVQRLECAITALQGASEHFHTDIYNYLLLAVNAALAQPQDVPITELSGNIIRSALRYGDHGVRFTQSYDIPVTFTFLPLQHAMLISLIRWNVSYKETIKKLNSDNVSDFIIATRVVLHPTLVYDVHEARKRWQQVGDVFMPMRYAEAEKQHTELVMQYGSRLAMLPIVRSWCSLVHSKLGEVLNGNEGTSNAANVAGILWQ